MAAWAAASVSHGVEPVDAVALLGDEAGEYQLAQAGGDAGAAETEQRGDLVLPHLHPAAGLAAGAQGEQHAVGGAGQVQGRDNALSVDRRVQQPVAH